MHTALLLLLLHPAPFLSSEDWWEREAAQALLTARLTAVEARALVALCRGDPEAQPRAHKVYVVVTIRELDLVAARHCTWPEAYRIGGWVERWQMRNLDDEDKLERREWWFPPPEVFIPDENPPDLEQAWIVPGGRYEFDPDAQRRHARKQLLAYVFRTGDREYVEKVIRETPRD